MYVTGVGHISLSSASIRSGEIIVPSKMWHQRASLPYPRFRTTDALSAPGTGGVGSPAPPEVGIDDLSSLHMQALRQGRASRPVSEGRHAGTKAR